MLRKALPNGPNAILRPLYYGILAKVSFVKWTKILTFVARSLFTWQTQKCQINLHWMNFKKSLGKPATILLATQIKF